MDVSKGGGITIGVTRIIPMENRTLLLPVTRSVGIKAYVNPRHITALNIKESLVVGNLVVKMVGGIMIIVKAITQNQDNMLTDMQ